MPAYATGETVTVSGTAIGGTAATYLHATECFMVVQDQPIRWRADGTDPTSAVGFYAPAGTSIQLMSYQEIANFRAISLMEVPVEMQRFKYIIVSSAVALALTAANLSAQQGPAVPGTGGGGGGAGDASAANQSAQIALEAKIATGTAGTATGSSTTPSVNVSSAADEIVVDTLNIIHTGTLTVDGSQTQRWQGIGGFGAIKYAGSTETGAGTTTMSWSNSTSQDWALSAVSVKPSGSDAGASGDALFFGIGL